MLVFSSGFLFTKAFLCEPQVVIKINFYIPRYRCQHEVQIRDQAYLIGGNKVLKINQDLRVGLKTNHNDLKQVNQSGNRFGEMVIKQGTKMQTETLTRLLGDISQAGERVAKSRNLRELARFKMLVKRFLQEAVDYGLEMKQSHTWNRFGEGRRLKIVETIDERLVELAGDILNEEKATIDLLDKIGEIKGLLINLYM